MASVALEEVRFDTDLVQYLLDDWNDELIATIPGFTPRSGSTVEATDFERPDGVFLLALSNDGPVGCGGLRRIAPGIAEVKRLYVRSRARSRGTGRALLQHLEKHAHELGFTKVRLDTAGGQPAALALFRSAGYQPIADYNGNPHARYWFEKRLTARN
jgi:GNAT superfamily N-acetyltransferase